MRNAQPRTLQFYRTPNGRVPFTEWFESLCDQKTRTRIRRRLIRLEEGNFGDYRSVGEGVFELRLHFGPGYRIYYGEVGNQVILVLCGGDKSSQQRDIEQAKTFWLEYKAIKT